ncbi:MAG: hypothetical protein HQ477_01885 [Chloroflexi bacterium]|nr:hypothetical protein [Chloroflexota bacterium]
MFTRIDASTLNRTLALLLLPLFGILLVAMSCAPTRVDEWVELRGGDSDEPEFLYYVLKVRTPDDKDNRKGTAGSEDKCQLLPFKKYDIMDPHGKHHYAALTANDLIWVNCWDYDTTSKPPLVINSIPPEFADQMGIEIPQFTIIE